MMCCSDALNFLSEVLPRKHVNECFGSRAVEKMHNRKDNGRLGGVFFF